MKRNGKILIVEDNPLDVEIMQLLLRDHGLTVSIDVCQDGEEASLYFSQRDRASALPDLVLLDLNLPKMHGSEVLQQIKADPFTQNIPVIILTSSDRPSELDPLRAYPKTTCLTKPYLLKEYGPIINTIKEALLPN